MIHVFRVFFVIASCVFLSACGEQVRYEDADKSVYHIPAMEWHVVSEAEMLRMYKSAGMELRQGDKLKGFAGRCAGVPCIVTTRPKYVDDGVVMTVGHEFMHIALGDYHK